MSHTAEVLRHEDEVCDLHCHIAALPPGVPYAEQQLEALLLKRGLLELSEAELADLAQRIVAAMPLVSRL